MTIRFGSPPSAAYALRLDHFARERQLGPVRIYTNLNQSSLYPVL
jgi:hypothetical protein